MGIYDFNENTVVTEVGDEYVMLDMEKGIYYSANAVGRTMLELLQEHQNADVVADKLTEEFDVDKQTAAGDLSRFVQELQDAGMLAHDAATGGEPRLNSTTLG